MPLPWIPAAIRTLLLVPGNAFAELITHDRVGYAAPSDVTSRFVVIQAPGGASMSGDDVAYAPLVQVDGYGPDTPDGQQQAWDLVAAAASVLGRARNITYESITYSARLTDGPMQAPNDISRGPGNPLYRAVLRAELTVHHH